MRTKRDRWLIAALIWATGLVAACAIAGIEDADFADAGTVRFVDVEGGCWVIETESERYEPINLASEFRVDGLFVLFRASERRDLASICQVGRIVEVVSIGVPDD